MREINLFDSNFVGQACSVALQTPRLMRYVRGQTNWSGITVFTDGYMFDPVVGDVQSRFKIGWLHEARSLHPENYARIGDVAHRFDAIMTHDAHLLAHGSPFIKTIRGGSWVTPEQWGMYPKSKNVSMILSEKAQIEGHRLRHAIADAGLPIDLYGPQYTPIGHDKALAYRDYRFAVVVEACREDNFFSEHLIDALAFGCVPIYWGCPNIGEWFDEDSVLGFNTIAELSDWIALLAQDWHAHYDDVDFIAEANQQTARAYAITEDWKVAHCLRPYLEAL